ncbi:MAG: hypothetical protein ACFFCI_25720 [Promethearchaeota archaeon]
MFTETIFNAHVQNETLNATTIYRDDEELFKFISVGRDGETEQACDEIDFIIIRFDISSEDAMEVLNLLLECLVNETTNETAIVYSYVSKKENGTAAVMMNLPFSVLGLIPWYCDFENSPMGSKPETFEDWFWKPLAAIGILIVGVIVTIGMAFVELFMMMVDFFVAIFMDILPILGYILWLIILAIIFILALIMLALTIFGIIIAYLFMLLMVPIILLSGGNANPGVMSFEFTLKDTTMKTNTYIDWKKNDYLNLSLPIIVRKESINGTVVSHSKEGIITNFVEYKQFELNFSSSTQEDNGPVSSQGDNTKLINGNLSPDKGDELTKFKFIVTYIDLNNTAPEEGFPVLRIVHDDWKESYRTYEMEPVEIDDLNYTDGKGYEIELKFDDIGKYEFYFLVKVNKSGTIQTFETSTAKFYVRLSTEEIIASVCLGINLVFTVTAIIIGALGLSAKSPQGALISGIAFVIAMILIYFSHLQSDSQTEPQEGFGMALGCFVAFLILVTFRIGRWATIKDIAKFKVNFLIKLMYLLISTIGVIFLTGADIIISMIGSIFTGLISGFILCVTTRATVALLWGSKDAIKGPQNVSIISKCIYYVMMGMLYIFYFLFLFSSKQKISEG